MIAKGCAEGTSKSYHYWEGIHNPPMYVDERAGISARARKPSKKDPVMKEAPKHDLGRKNYHFCMNQPNGNSEPPRPGLSTKLD
jgi:hypothetical protein